MERFFNRSRYQSIIGFGIFVASILPWTNLELMGRNLFWNYAQSYLFNIIPNMLLIGALIFLITTLSRSMFAVFAVVIIVNVAMVLVDNLARQIDNQIFAALLDPSGLSEFLAQKTPKNSRHKMRKTLKKSHYTSKRRKLRIFTMGLRFRWIKNL